MLRQGMLFVVKIFELLSYRYGVTGFAISQSWHFIFFLEAFIVFWCAILCYFVPMHNYPKFSVEPDPKEQIPEIDVRLTSIGEDDSEIAYMIKKGMMKPKPHSVFSSILPLAKNPVYVAIVALTCIYGKVMKVKE